MEEIKWQEITGITETFISPHPINNQITITGDSNMTKAFNPHHEKSKKASIDKVAADEYMRYMGKDNQDILLEEHKGATHFAYTKLDDFMKNLKLPKRGEEIKDDELVIDILGEYMSTLAEELHPNHPIKKRLKGKKTIDEKMQEISHIASDYLGLDARYVGQLKEMVKNIREAEASLGSPEKKITESEKNLYIIDKIEDIDQIAEFLIEIKSPKNASINDFL